MNRRLLVSGAIAVAALAIAGEQLPNVLAPRGMLAELIHGARPSYGPERVSEVPNEQAIVQRLWVPGLDDGFDPQGLALVDGAIVVSGYRSTAFNVNRGPCRVFRLDRDSGQVTAHLDVPPPCGHAGGVADDGEGGMLYIADTKMLFATLLRQAFSDRALPFRGTPLGDGVVGALAMSSRKAVWLGTYREKEIGRLYRFAADRIASLPYGTPLNVADAEAQVPIPTYAQGAAVDPHGALWISRSDARWGELDRLDAATGAVSQRYQVPAQIEGIAFDPKGLLWAVSEAGVRHNYDNFLVRQITPFFPLIYAIDPAKLE
jgi:DNA-binding beta-propeller fold protein YncE